MIRPARAEDAEAITALEAEAFGPGAWSRAQVEDELGGDTRRVLVAVVDGHVVGYASIAVAADSADLTRILVAESHRRAGLASELLAAQHESARQAGAQRILLEVAESNVGAIALYVAHGYLEIARRRGYYPNGEDALVFAGALA